jgi:flagellar biosynthesis/type III secretory pathway protein FliH
VQTPELDNIELAPVEESKVDVRSVLLEMSKREREALIADIFADDLASIVEAEIQKGFKAGLAKGEEKAAHALNTELQVQRDDLTKVKDQMTTLFEQLAKSDVTIALESESEIHKILTTAVFKLLGERLHSAEYLEQAIEFAKNELIQSSLVQLCLSPDDYNYLQSNRKNQDVENLRLKKDESLSIGSYRFELAKGRVESNFSDKLALWTQQLADLHREN